MSKSEIIKQIQAITGDKSAAGKAKLEAQPVDVLRRMLALAKEQAGKKQVPAKRKSSKAAKAKAKAAKKPSKKPSRKAKRGTKLTKSLKSRVAILVRAIKDGRISSKKGIKSPSAYKTGTARERAQKFVALYEGVVAKSRRKKAAVAKAGLKTVYAGISGSKKPYYLGKGYHVSAYNVGGGARGPGIVKAIPGSGAKPFSTLGGDAQAAVANFLNKGGAKLRSKGAPKVVDLGAIRALAQAAKKRTSSGKKKTGTANRWY